MTVYSHSQQRSLEVSGAQIRSEFRYFWDRSCINEEREFLKGYLYLRTFFIELMKLNVERFTSLPEDCITAHLDTTPNRCLILLHLKMVGIYSFL